MTQNLQRCPFCGGEDILAEQYWVGNGATERQIPKKMVVSCTNPECEASPSILGEENWNSLCTKENGE